MIMGKISFYVKSLQDDLELPMKCIPEKVHRVSMMIIWSRLEDLVLQIGST